MEGNINTCYCCPFEDLYRYKKGRDEPGSGMLIAKILCPVACDIKYHFDLVQTQLVNIITKDIRKISR
jgi:hypothetical protein